MASFEYLPLVLTGLGLTASIIYYASVLRNSNKTRQTQVIMNLISSFFSTETRLVFEQMMMMQWDDYEDFRRKYDSSVNPENYSYRYNLWKMFDNLGYMLHQGLTDIDTIYNLLGGANLLLFWEKFSPIVLKQRENYGESDYFEWWEYLIDEVSK